MKPRIERLMDLPTATMTVQELKAALGCTHQRVHQLLDETGLPYRRVRIPFGTRAEIACAYCGKLFTRPPSQLTPGQNWYCSMECSGLGRHKPREQHVCPGCGTSFERLPSKARRTLHPFCTLACYRGTISGRAAR